MAEALIPLDFGVLELGGLTRTYQASAARQLNHWIEPPSVSSTMQNENLWPMIPVRLAAFFMSVRFFPARSTGHKVSIHIKRDGLAQLLTWMRGRAFSHFSSIFLISNIIYRYWLLSLFLD